MCQILLGLIVDLPLSSGSSSAQVLKATCGLLDYLYLAQLLSQTTDTILRLKKSLVAFHQNKDMVIDLGVRDCFNIPKIHSLLHYGPSILLFGTTDNYNTKQTEQLHINFTNVTFLGLQFSFFTCLLILSHHVTSPFIPLSHDHIT